MSARAVSEKEGDDGGAMPSGAWAFENKFYVEILIQESTRGSGDFPQNARRNPQQKRPQVRCDSEKVGYPEVL